GARGGIALSAGAANYFGFVPLGSDLLAGARLQIAAALPSESSRWLSNATLGLTGGFDVGDRRGVDAQLCHGGFVFALRAPWSRDVLGVAVEGGLIAGRYYDSNPTAIQQSNKRMVAGPYGESMSARFYGLGRLILQVPVRGDVRPFLAGEAGAGERPDG